MRILLLHDYGVPIGGAEHMTFALRDGFRRRGHDVHLLTSSATHGTLANRADRVCYGTESLVRRVLQVANPSAVATVRRTLAEFRPDVVHVRSFLMQLSPCVLPPLHGPVAVLHAVDYQLVCPLGSKRLPDGSRCHHRAGLDCRRTGCASLAGVARATAQRRMWNRWHDVFDAVIANSEWTAARLRTDGIHVDRAIWNGVPTSASRSLMAETPTVVFVGRLNADKGIEPLVRAMRQVVDAVPAARLVVAGDGPERARVEQAVTECGLAAHTTLLGNVPRTRLNEVTAGAWVQAVPSQWEEPFGLAAAEAMMRGTAVVASNFGGLTEIIKDGTTGLLVDTRDGNALARALVRLLSDRATCERMGAEGRRFALAELSEDGCVDRLLALYDELRTRRSTARATS
jgi:glycosyltransferase involved in cell wall biosynthesis